MLDHSVVSIAANPLSKEEVRKSQTIGKADVVLTQGKIRNQIDAAVPG